MLTLVIESEYLAKRVEKALEGFEPFDNGEITINKRDDDETYELCLGEESLDDVVAILDE